MELEYRCAACYGNRCELRTGGKEDDAVEPKGIMDGEFHEEIFGYQENT